MAKQIHIDGIIGLDFSAKDFREQSIGQRAIELVINSPGGDLPEGLAIYNLIHDHRKTGATVTARVIGICGSIATYIATAVEKVAVEENAAWIIHNPWTATIGDFRDMAKSAEILTGLRTTIGKAYSDRIGKPLHEVFTLMDDETWYFSGEEIAEAGFADAVIPASASKKADRNETAAHARAQFQAMAAKLRDKAQPIERLAALIQPAAVTNEDHTMLEQQVRAQIAAEWRTKHPQPTSTEQTDSPLVSVMQKLYSQTPERPQPTDIPRGTTPLMSAVTRLVAEMGTDAEEPRETGLIAATKRIAAQMSQPGARHAV